MSINISHLGQLLSLAADNSYLQVQSPYDLTSVSLVETLLRKKLPQFVQASTEGQPPQKHTVLKLVRNAEKSPADWSQALDLSDSDTVQWIAFAVHLTDGILPALTGGDASDEAPAARRIFASEPLAFHRMEWRCEAGVWEFWPRPGGSRTFTGEEFPESLLPAVALERAVRLVLEDDPSESRDGNELTPS